MCKSNHVIPCSAFFSVFPLSWVKSLHNKACEILMIWLSQASPASSPVPFPKLSHIAISSHNEFLVVPQRHCIIPCFWPFACITLCPKSPNSLLLANPFPSSDLISNPSFSDSTRQAWDLLVLLLSLPLPCSVSLTGLGPHDGKVAY